MWNNDLFRWKDGTLGCDLSTRAIKRDLEGVCITFELLSGNRESLFLFLLGFENEILEN